ncbi:hypothetical protein [Paludibaculum fermentans]|uniref:Glycine zipper 2TM domain-containing protein n=1 Tax=Paludibaculum fermentans TaxID=1473598 RepID=A0A7S7SLA8_PALFE|nr:hypothetical protein [Paludibaculum fermentans]QOY88628.1 hypothetical protein IRI77_01310 [Paludibaculum fermentans]
MKLGSWVKSNIEYGRDLVESGLEGASTVRKASFRDDEIAGEFSRAAEESLLPTLLGICIGAAAGYITDDRKSKRGALIGGVVGGAIGFTGGLAWGSRRVTGALAGGAIKKINAARDEHWLEKHPVVYG